MHAPDGTQPSGGWRFPVNDTVMLTAPLKGLLIERITRWRIRNGAPAGSPEEEVDAYLCALIPGFCHSTKKDYELPAHLMNNRKFMDRLGEWVWTLKTEMPPGGYALVPEAQAVQRVSACAGCPRNRVMRTDCPACASAFDEAFSEIRGLRPKPASCGSLACALFGFDTWTAACLPRVLVEPNEEMKSHAPPHCWLTKPEVEPAATLLPEA